MTSLTARAADPDAETDYWESVSIDVSDLNAQINQFSCAYHVRVFFGCVEAVKEMASYTGKFYDLYPVEVKTDKPAFITAGRFKLVEADKVDIKTTKDLVEVIKSKRTELQTRFFSSSVQYIQNPSSDFEDLIAQIQQRLPKKLTKAQIGSVLSKLLEVSIDPHTMLRPAKAMTALMNESSSSFVGIGVQYSPVESGMLLIEVFENSGAMKANLKAGDIITAVDGKLTKGLSTEQIGKLLMGLENTTVEATVYRNSKPFKVTITRGKVEAKVVSGKIIFDGPTKVGYLKITNFMYSQMCAEAKVILQDFEEKQVNGIVLDLRGNPGGGVDNDLCLGGYFLGKNKVVSYFEKRSMTESSYQPLKSTTDLITKKPLVVLINSSSASASEIMSGALQDYARALVVGQTSFGKGSYQGCGPANAKKDLMMCQTGGLFHLPSGRTNQTVGVVPDISVYIKNTPMEFELYPLTEANMYLFPLDAKVMPNSHPEKWPKISVPKSCMSSLNLQKKFQEVKVGQYYYNDYQLLNGVAAISCLAN